jgi:hypothetical protein
MEVHDNFMLPDFAVSWKDIIGTDGTLQPPLTLQASGLTWAADQDGLLMTTAVLTMSEDTCLLSVLFRMSYGDAIRRMRRKLFPAMPLCWLTVTKKLDEVCGHSGERYSRFIAHIEDF